MFVLVRVRFNVVCLVVGCVTFGRVVMVLVNFGDDIDDLFIDRFVIGLDGDDRRVAGEFDGDADGVLFVLFRFVAVAGAIFFKCSTRCVVLFILSNDFRFRVMIFCSLNSATSAFRVRCPTRSIVPKLSRSNRTCACDKRCRFRLSGVANAGDFVLLTPVLLEFWKKEIILAN